MKSTFYSSSWASGTSLVLLEILNQMLREKKNAKQHKELSQLPNRNKSGCVRSKNIKDGKVRNLAFSSSDWGLNSGFSAKHQHNLDCDFNTL